MKSFIPFTSARRDRLFDKILHKKAGGADGLALVEWEDGSQTLKPVQWDPDNSAIVDEDGNRWFARGLGSEPKNLAGVPVWNVFNGNAGIISNEAALVADAEEYQDRVYDVAAGDTLPDDLIAEGLVDPNQQRGPADVWNVEAVDEEVVEIARAIAEGRLEDVPATEALTREVDPVDEDVEPDGDDSFTDRLFTDGGVATADATATTSIPQPSDLDEGAAVYDLRPPDGYDGVAFSIRSADYYDPNPVTKADAQAAVEWGQRAEQEKRDRWMIGFIVGLAVFGAIWLLMTVIPWLLGQIGGGGGGGSTVGAALVLFAAPGSPVRTRVESAVETVTSAVKGLIP